MNLGKSLSDWSLIMGRQGGGGGYKTGGRHVKFYPCEKWGWKKFSHAEGRAKEF